MNIAIIGASGSIGTAVTKQLLANTNHVLILFSHNAEKIHYRPEDEARLNQIDGSILNEHDITHVLSGADVAIYLVHLMGGKSNEGSFIDREKTAVDNFVHAAKHHKVKRVIYVGGMGSENQKLTKHLVSRQNTGRTLKRDLPLVIEFNVPMVIGPKAAGFEVIRSLVNHTRVLPVPTWANAITNPIALSDVSNYVVAAINAPISNSRSIPIGGPEALSYREVIKRYAKFKRKSVLLIPVPFAPKSIVSFLFRLNPNSKALVTVADMIESAGYSVAFRNSEAAKHFPSIRPKKIKSDFF